MPCLNQNELCINFKKAVVRVGLLKCSTINLIYAQIYKILNILEC